MTPKANQVQGWYANIKRQLDELGTLADETAAEVWLGDTAEIAVPLIYPDDVTTLDELIAYLTLMRGILTGATEYLRPCSDFEGAWEVACDVDGEMSDGTTSLDEMDEAATECEREYALWR